EARDAAFTERAHFVRAELSARLHDHPRADLLTVLPVGHADHLHVLDLRVSVQELLDLPRIHVLAPADHHVLEPPDDVAVARGVERREVAGVHPARGVHRFRGLLGVVPVPEHHAVPARAELPGHAGGHDLPPLVYDLHLHVRVDAADRRHAPLHRVVDRALEAHRARLGHAVADRDLAHVHLGDHALHDLNGTR